MKNIDSKELCKIQLDVLKEVHSFCVKHNIKYWLSYGTLLGAIRHNGFIPWDDDVDIAMPREDYDRFFREFKHEYYEAFNCDNNSKYLYHFGKVYDQRTVLIEHNNFTLETGVYIDVFPIDNLSDSDECVKEYCKKMAFYKHIHNLKKNKVYGYHRGLLRTVKFMMFKPFSYFYPIKRLVKKMDSLMQSFNGKPTNAGSFLGGAYVSPLLKPYDVILHKFEDFEFYVPSQYDSWLSAEYGDYMTPPPIEKRVSAHVFKAWWK